MWFQNSFNGHNELIETKLHRLRKVPLVAVQLNGSVLVVLVVVARRKQDQLALLRQEILGFVRNIQKLDKLVTTLFTNWYGALSSFSTSVKGGTP